LCFPTPKIRQSSYLFIRFTVVQNLIVHSMNSGVRISNQGKGDGFKCYWYLNCKVSEGVRRNNLLFGKQLSGRMCSNAGQIWRRTSLSEIPYRAAKLSPDIHLHLNLFWVSTTHTVKVKQSRYRPGVSQRFPGS